MWMDEEVSEYVYEKCLTNDKKKYWSLIIDSEWAYMYCQIIEDREEVRKYITDPDWVKKYQNNH